MRKDAEEEPLDGEVAALRRRVAELEQALAEARRSGAAPLEERHAGQDLPPDLHAALQGAGHTALLDAIPALVFFKSRDHRYLLVNKSYAEHYRLPLEKILGKRDEEIFPPEIARSYRDNDEAIMASGVPRSNVELRWKREDGTYGWTLENILPFRDAGGRVAGIVGVLLDMTDRKEAEEALRRTESELLATEARLLDTIAAMSTPVLPIDDGILVLPIVGHVDAARSDRLMEALLHGVERHDADFVILDLTGVPMIDSAVAFHLLRAVQAVLLLGAQCVLVGISAGIAQSLAHTGEALEQLVILRDLRAGVRYAMARRRSAARSSRQQASAALR
ncbi:PAS domain-containing protein [Sorangium sp. So ce131]|uniref:PAS domain-containing protein n=1 Tax=Sorangium sp. So ce131 TaxID=3133282 RepID=UPI003F60128B